MAFGVQLCFSEISRYSNLQTCFVIIAVSTFVWITSVDQSIFFSSFRMNICRNKTVYLKIKSKYKPPNYFKESEKKVNARLLNSSDIKCRQKHRFFCKDTPGRAIMYIRSLSFILSIKQKTQMEISYTPKHFVTVLVGNKGEI